MDIVNTYAPVTYNSSTGRNDCVMFVLTKAPGGHKVYMGICTLQAAREEAPRATVASEIASRGLALSYTQALAAFPDLTKEEYRA